MSVTRKIDEWLSYHNGIEKYGQNSAIFKMDLNSSAKLFDFLPLKDLNSLAQTCKSFHRVTGDYFQKNAIEVNYGTDGFVTKNLTRVNAFVGFIQKICIQRHDLNSFYYIAVNCTSLKEIQFMGINLRASALKCMKKTLNQIEIIKIHNVTIECKFYEEFLQFCTHLKRLSIQKCKLNVECDWMSKKYPTLEYFELIEFKNLKFDDLKKFFKENLHIKQFSTDTKFIVQLSELKEELNVKLDELTIVRGYRDVLIDDLILYHLINLNNIGFYKRLHLQGAYFSIDGWILQNYIDKIAKLKTLESFQFRSLVYITPIINLSSLTQLKELKMNDPKMCTNIENLATEFLQLERIFFTNSALDDIEPFLKYTAKLKEIHLFGFIRNGKHIINLSTLNDARMKLTYASKVTIHVNESIYFVIKWTNTTTNFKFIELKRC